MNRSFAPCAAIRQSQASARSIPPPTACPFISARVGTPAAAIRSHARLPRSVTSLPGSSRTRSRSAPEQKMRLPEPVIAIIRTDSSAASRSTSSASCSRVSSASALSPPWPRNVSTASPSRTAAVSTTVGPGGGRSPTASISSAFDSSL